MNILLTGATGRVGKATALLLNTKDHKLGLVARDDKKLTALSKILPHCSNTFAIDADLTSTSGIEDICVRAMSHFKTIDVLINNAACFNFNNLVDSSSASLNAVIQTNLTSVILLTRAILPRMIENKRGIIINIASTAGQQYLPGASAYCASKFGLFGFTGALAEEVREHGIRVCTIAPGQLTVPVAHDQKTIPPQEVAQLIHFLIHYPGTKSFPNEIILNAI